MSGKFITVSGILTALLSSACCILPLMAIITGTGGLVSTFTWLEPFRPYLMGLTISALGFAWYRKLTPRKENNCNCDGKRTSFWQTKSFLIIITVIAGLLLAFPEYAHVFYSKAQKKEVINVDRKKINEVSFIIRGMACGGCSEHVKTTLASVNGVIECEASYERGNSVVKFDESKTSPDSLAAAISKAGYKVVSITLAKN